MTGKAKQKKTVAEMKMNLCVWFTFPAILSAMPNEDPQQISRTHVLKNILCFYFRSF